MIVLLRLVIIGLSAILTTTGLVVAVVALLAAQWLVVAVAVLLVGGAVAGLTALLKWLAGLVTVERAEGGARPE